MLLHVETAFSFLIGDGDQGLKRCGHLQIRQAASELLLHILVHAADPQVQIALALDTGHLEAVADTGCHRQRGNLAVKDIEAGTGIVGISVVNQFS